MRCALFRSILMLTFVLAAPSARAFFDPPWITPASPRVGEPVYLDISGGICDVFFSTPGYPEVTQEGTAIRVLEYGHHEDFQDFCIYGLWTVAVPIGALSAGDYTVEADFLYNDPITGLTTVNLGVVPFSVAAAPPAMPVPTCSMSGIFVMMMLICVTALSSMRGKVPT